MTDSSVALQFETRPDPGTDSGTINGDLVEVDAGPPIMATVEFAAATIGTRPEPATVARQMCSSGALVIRSEEELAAALDQPIAENRAELAERGPHFPKRIEEELGKQDRGRRGMFVGSLIRNFFVSSAVCSLGWAALSDSVVGNTVAQLGVATFAVVSAMVGLCGQIIRSNCQEKISQASGVIAELCQDQDRLVETLAETLSAEAIRARFVPVPGADLLIAPATGLSQGDLSRSVLHELGETKAAAQSGLPPIVIVNGERQPDLSLLPLDTLTPGSIDQLVSVAADPAVFISNLAERLTEATPEHSHLLEHVLVIHHEHVVPEERYIGLVGNLLAGVVDNDNAAVASAELLRRLPEGLREAIAFRARYMLLVDGEAPTHDLFMREAVVDGLGDSLGDRTRRWLRQEAVRIINDCTEPESELCHFARSVPEAEAGLVVKAAVDEALRRDKRGQVREILQEVGGLMDQSDVCTEVSAEVARLLHTDERPKRAAKFFDACVADLDDSTKGALVPLLMRKVLDNGDHDLFEEIGRDNMEFVDVDALMKALEADSTPANWAGSYVSTFAQLFTVHRGQYATRLAAEVRTLLSFNAAEDPHATAAMLEDVKEVWGRNGGDEFPVLVQQAVQECVSAGADFRPIVNRFPGVANLVELQT